MAPLKESEIPRLPNPDADHYRLPGSDRPMPRTTSVIDRGIGKPFLTKWAGNLERQRVMAELEALMAEELDPEQATALVARLQARLAREPYCEVEKNAAGAFGTAAHGLVEAHLRERLGLPPETESPGPDRPGFDPELVARAGQLAIDWLDAVGFEPDPEGVEERLWSVDEHLWSAGTADAFGTANLAGLIAHSSWNRPPKEVDVAPDLRVPVLIDLKTSKSIGVAHKVQTAAYVTYLLERKRIEAPCHTCILRVATTADDRRPTEAILIHPDEFIRYGSAFRFIRRIYNFLSQEEVLERKYWRQSKS